MTRRHAPRPADDGFSLAELIVAMALMGIVMAVSTASIVVMYRSSARSEALSGATQQLNQAFVWLDRQVRYADYIGPPTRGADGNWQVVLEAAGPAGRQPVCRQLRLDTAARTLQTRDLPGGAWRTLAAGITSGGATDAAGSPFAVGPAPRPATASPPPWGPKDQVPNARLTVALVARQADPPDSPQTAATVDLVSLNIGTATRKDSACAAL